VEIYPAIDIRGGRCVRLLQGDYDRQIDYAEDPLRVAEHFQQQGARWVHVVDLDGAKSGRPQNLDLVRRICADSGLAVQFGGGLRDESAIDEALAAGVSRVVLGTRALEDWEWFVRLVSRPEYAGRVALGLDARGRHLAVRGWQMQTGLSIDDVLGRLAGLSVAAVIYTDISRDGMLEGPNLDALAEAVRLCPVPLVASGGMSTLQDLLGVAAVGAAGAIIGRALYEGRIDLAEAVRTLQATGGP